ncbi:hypothetical protein FB45DRAFT_736700 [Roridomyces roridus]|uniref:SET domain-containing protein n=1 Tax=Roridomyces roridus TaxID=1738132 RepID=A0AAD7CBU1_9AGAR|nr:hypothetical protein FB45DRAFT_736700 [Roridomyces roridus]
MAFYGWEYIGVFEPKNPFVLVDIPGKGQGLVATRFIEQGELVLREEPLFVVPQQTTESPTALISRLLNDLDASDREAFLNLTYVHFPEGLDPETHPEEVALAIFQTNAAAAGDGAGLFPLFSRLNHGCSNAFNVVYSFSLSQRALFVYALKDIERGQELLDAYTDTKRTRKERRKYLAEHYGFDCKCPVCSLDDAASKASDERLTAMAHLYERLSTWSEGTIDGVEAIKTANQIWKLGDEEGYWSARGQLAADAARISAAHSDASSAKSWAQKAIEWYTYELGEDSDLVAETRATADQPQEHPAWASRETLSVGGPV